MPSDKIPSLKDEAPIDTKRRHFFKWVLSLMGGFGLLAAAFPFLAYWKPGAKARAAAAPVNLDLTDMQPGEIKKVQWRGKPVWVIYRTEESLKGLADHEDKLRDPESKTDQQPDYARNRMRSRSDKYLVLVGVCTHLGCAPSYRPEVGDLGETWPGGFFCPCHGSTFDLAGRVFKDVPAPINLEVPPHYFPTPSTLVIGESAKGVA